MNQTNYLLILPKEILIELLKKLCLQELMNMTVTNTALRMLIQSTEWDQLIVSPPTLEKTRYIISTYKFKKYELGNFLNITENKIRKIGSIWHNMALLHELSNDDLMVLNNCHTIYINNRDFTSKIHLIIKKLII